MSDYLHDRTEAERAANTWAARTTASIVGVVMLCVAAYHYGGAWLVVVVVGIVLARAAR
jgi:hypothetical protein